MRSADALVNGAGSIPQALRVLLVAYEFPPSPSPQSLRWAYLTRELCNQGVEVHVLTPAAPGAGGTDLSHDARVVVHRTYPGLLSGSAGILRHWRNRVSVPPGFEEDVEGSDGGEMGGRAAVLNWKGRLMERVQRFAGACVFPDARGEWRPFAKSRLKQLLRELRPDVVVGSHEPATSLQVALVAARSGYPLLADMGDPVLCFYTPKRWRRRAHAVERTVCRHAAHVSVTTVAARRALERRHGIGSDRVSVLRQGFDAMAEVQQPLDHVDIGMRPDLLDMLYTGSFYSFRRPVELVRAVVAAGSARLSIATSRAPRWLREAAEAHPESIQVLGFLPHETVVALQRRADVLVNIANDDEAHIPGKLYEYLGSGRPILHLDAGKGDEAADLVRELRRGLVRLNEEGQIVDALDTLKALKSSGRMAEAFDLDPATVEDYSWQSIGRQLARQLNVLAGR